MLALYKTLVPSRLEYCVSAWSPHYRKDKDLLENVQRLFTKMIQSFQEMRYEERIRKLGLLSHLLEERRDAERI